MSTADIVLGVILVAGAIRGLKRGFVREVISLVGFPVALVLANQRDEEVAVLLKGLFGSYFTALQTPLIAKAVAFIVIVLVALILANLVAEVLHWLLGKHFLGFMNHPGGLLVGLAEAALAVEVVMLLLAVLSPAILSSILAQSTIATTLQQFAPLLDWLQGNLLPGSGLVPHLS